MQNILNKIVKISIAGLVFLVPLFWLPFSFEVFEYSKQYLLFFFCSLAFFAWLAKQVIYDKEIKLKHSPLDFFVLGFLLVAILSAVFSVDKSSSLYGFYARFSNGLIGLLSLVVLYFLVVNNVTANGKQPPTNHKSLLAINHLLKLFLWSSTLVVIIAYFSIFGIWAKINTLLPLPSVMLQNIFNPVAGSLEGLAVFLAVVILLLVSRTLAEGKKGRMDYLLILAALGLMTIIDFTPAWSILLITLILFVGFSMAKRLFADNVNRLLIPILLIIVAAVLLFFKPVKMGLAQEQILSQPIAWSVAEKSVVNNVKNGFLGSGIGTFHYDFAKYKPESINQTWLWQIRFDRGLNIPEILGTMGFLGLLSYVGLLGFFFLISWFLLSRRFSGLPFLVAFLGLVIGQFVYYQNTTLAFLFWLFLGLAVVSWQKPISEKTISFKEFPELALVFSTLVIVLGIGLLAVYFYAVKFYLADVDYSRAISLLGDARIKNLEKAVNLNPGLPQYRTALARTYLNEALLETGKTAAERDSAKIQLLVSKSIEQARASTILQPNQIANWETLGVVYREIGGIATGATDWGIKSFETAVELEPTNPVLYTELGKLYLTSGQTDKAKEEFTRALEKKSDYADALIQQALVLEKEDIIDEAIKKLESVVQVNPYNIDALFQLGRLYFNNRRVDEAISLFNAIVILLPNHSNAHYSLGVAYASQKKNQLAIEEFEKVLELNPGNQDVMQKLESLKGE